MISRGTTFEFEYLGEFEIEIKNILEHESGGHMGLIHEKNQRPKISCYCTFKIKINNDRAISDHSLLNADFCPCMPDSVHNVRGQPAMYILYIQGSKEEAKFSIFISEADL
jgi:hypothetical protein